jgi:hypothetical protein
MEYGVLRTVLRDRYSTPSILRTDWQVEFCFDNGWTNRLTYRPGQSDSVMAPFAAATETHVQGGPGRLPRPSYY